MRLLTDKQRKRKLKELRDRMLLEAEEVMDQIDGTVVVLGGDASLEQRKVSAEVYRSMTWSLGALLSARDEIRYEATEGDDER